MKIISKSKQAFTLIEIMVATVIMVILVGLVIQITSQVLNVWTKSSGRMSANAEARIAMDILTQDLETAVFRNNSLQWLRSEDASFTAQGLGDVTNTVALRLFSPALDRPTGPGDVCAIAYQLKFANPVTADEGAGTPDDRTFVLYRLVVDPTTTFNTALGTGNQETLPAQAATTWAGQSIVGSDAATGDQGTNYLVSNIAGFEIDFHVQDDGDLATPTLVPDSTIYGGTDATIGPEATVAHFQQPLAYAEIRLTVLTDEGVGVLQNLPNFPTGLSEVVRQYGQVFTRRVNFPASPL